VQIVGRFVVRGGGGSGPPIACNACTSFAGNWARLICFPVDPTQKQAYFNVGN
jgi:hypothetical protein